MLYQETWNLSPCEAAAGGAHPPGRLDAFSEENKHGSPCPRTSLGRQEGWGHWVQPCKEKVRGARQMEGRAPEHMDEDLCRQPLSAEEDLGFAQARGTPAGSISTEPAGGCSPCQVVPAGCLEASPIPRSWWCCGIDFIQSSCGAAQIRRHQQNPVQKIKY